MLRTVLALALSLVVSAPSFAGIVDSPLPELEPGKTTVHLYSVPGIIEAGGLSTFFSCTTTDSANVRVGVETFGTGGGFPLNNAATTSINMVPGGSQTWGTDVAAGITVSANLAIPSITKGSARILATSKKVVCTAYVADNAGSPPASGWHLTIIAKTKQKAAN